MKKIPVGITIGLMAITAAVTFIVTSNVTLDMFNQKIKSVNEKQEFYSKLSEIDTYVRTHYISEIDESRLIEGMVSGYISGVGDPYAEYITADEYARRLSEQTGVTDGLGFGYEKEKSGYITVTEVTPGSSAEESGLQAGDVIAAVNNIDVIAYEGGYDEAVKLFSCAEGTRVRLKVRRADEDGRSDFIDYDVISQRTERMTVSGRLIEDIGYVRISSFTDKTEAQLKAKLDELISGGAKGLVFDLRSNAGGSMESFAASIDHILGAGDIVTAQYKSGNTEIVVSCTEAEKLKMPMSVIINQNTKGTAELFALALRDNAQAHTIGKSTSGMGYLTKAYTCSDGSVLILSEAVLRTSSEEDFNETGIKPEFDVTLPEDTDFSTLSNEAALLMDTQLMKALEVTVPKEDDVILP